MGNKCNCIASQSTDEAEDALLGSEQRGISRNDRPEQQGRQRRFLFRPNRQISRETPRGPPPPYQQVNPFYMLTEEQRVQIMTRITLIHSLPVGHYKCSVDDKKEPLLEKEVDCCEKSDKLESRECPICINEFLHNDPIRLLPCMHYYHTRCIDEWLMRANTCPSCMQRVDLAPTTTTHHRGHSRSVSRGSASGITVVVHSENPTQPVSSPTRSISGIEQLPNPTPTSPPPTSC